MPSTAEKLLKMQLKFEANIFPFFSALSNKLTIMFLNVFFLLRPLDTSFRAFWTKTTYICIWFELFVKHISHFVTHCTVFQSFSIVFYFFFIYLFVWLFVYLFVLLYLLICILGFGQYFSAQQSQSTFALALFSIYLFIYLFIFYLV